VERAVLVQGHGHYLTKTVRVLQQWWEAKLPDRTYYGEWRDVPLEAEENT
jgi:hypothetical protein